MRRLLLGWVIFAGCASPAAAERPTPETPAALSAEAQAALDQQATGIDLTAFELVARVEPTGTDGLKLSVVCFARADRALRAQVQVTGHGPRTKLIGSMIAKAARDLSAECR